MPKSCIKLQIDRLLHQSQKSIDYCLNLVNSELPFINM